MQTGTAVARVAPIEGASGQDRQIERREIRRADDLILGARPLTVVERRIADDLERHAASIEEIERQRARPGDARDTRNGGDLGLDLIVELLQRRRRSGTSSPTDRRASRARSRRDTRDRTLRRRSSVRSRRPAPNSSRTAVATSPMTSSPRSRPPPASGRGCPDRMTSADEKSVAFHAGITPKSSPTSSAAAAQKRDDAHVEGRA